MPDQFLYVERYRPDKIKDCILPQRIKKHLSGYVKEGRIPNILLEGPPGCGKTTAAIAMCKEIGLDYILMNSSKNRGIDTMQVEIVEYASGVSFSGKGKVIIMDEADGLTQQAQDAFKGIVERFSSNCTFILTANFASKLSEAIRSRMVIIPFHFRKAEAKKLQLEMFERLGKILKQNGIDYEDKPLAVLVNRFYPDFRRTLGELQKYTLDGKINESIIDEIGKTGAISDLIKAMKDKDFNKAREWIANNDELDPAIVYRKIYDEIYQYIEKDSIAQAVVLIGKYQFQHSMVPDPELNMAAFVVEMMLEVDMK